jgi:ATP-dependent Clp protease ATP-binding subunit ClpB
LLTTKQDQASKDRLVSARKAIADVEDRLTPLRAAYENEKTRGDEVANLRRKIDELKAKAADAERRYDLTTASDLRYYAIPDAQKRLTELEKAKADQMDSGEGNDVVNAEQIAEIVARWTSKHLATASSDL